MNGLPTRTSALTLLAAGAFLVGCSETPSPTGPGSERPAFAVGDAGDNIPNLGQIEVCKSADSNVPGEFTVVLESGTGTVLANPTINPGDCVVVAEDASEGDASLVTITEISDGFVSVSGQRIDDPGAVITPIVFANGGTVLVNAFHGAAIVFHNLVVEEPPAGCTYTKGWYQNKNGSPTVIAVDGRTIAEAQAIFKATPGKPGAVTWEGGNNTLNLYQQLLAALNNLGGDAFADAGPDEVDDAIAAALAGTGGTGTNITTTLTPEEIGELTEVLSSFNEGLYTGWPHCDSVVES